MLFNYFFFKPDVEVRVDFLDLLSHLHGCILAQLVSHGDVLTSQQWSFTNSHQVVLALAPILLKSSKDVLPTCQMEQSLCFSP